MPHLSMLKAWRLTLAAGLLALVACGKKEAEAPAQSRTVPHSPQQEVAAEAEVKASSGPVELTLRIYKKRIKAGESIWEQLRLRNVGNESILVHDKIFQNPWKLGYQSPTSYSDRGFGIYLDIFGPDGKRLPGRPVGDDGNHMAQGVSGLLEIENPKEQAMVDSWKAQGLSFEEVNTRLVEFNQKKRLEKEIAHMPKAVELRPGETIETKSWFYYGRVDKYKKKPIPQPIGDFSRLEFFEFREPGIYRIRGVYDYDFTKQHRKSERELGISIKTYPEEVLVRTPWVEISVLP